jgi:branched-subunit amino acid aminotransferase/4-amino-4-deoxychorismate lyase
MSRGKICGYYVISQLSKKEAIACGFDEGILLDNDGYIQRAAVKMCSSSETGR